MKKLYNYKKRFNTKRSKKITKKLNQKSLKAISDIEQGRNLVICKDVEDLFKKLGI